MQDSDGNIVVIGVAEGNLVLTYRDEGNVLGADEEGNTIVEVADVSGAV